MADATVKHFIFVRFFPYELPNFQHDIFDVAFLSAQVSLAKNNLLKSLENQTNKNFEICFWANGRYFDNPKYEFIFTALKDCTSLTVKFIKKDDMADLVKVAYNEYDFVIQSRMDFDDFVHKEAVADVQSKVSECDRMLSYGYCKGYTYFNNKLYPFYIEYDKRGHIGLLQSLIAESAFAKKIPYVGAYTFNHVKIKPSLKEFLENNNVEFAENMFQQNVSTNAFIYFRHDTTLSNHKPRGKSITKITKKQLEDEFGFAGYELKSIK